MCLFTAPIRLPFTIQPENRNMQTPGSSTARSLDNYIFQFAASSPQIPHGNQICFAARSTGLFRSQDSGKTWENAYLSLNTRVALSTTSVALAPDFEHDPTVIAGLNGAILCSYDGGMNWHRSRLPTPPPAISALAIPPNYTEDGIIFAGTNEDGVIVSNDRGHRWASWNFGLLDLHILCLGISPDFAADETLFAGTESGLFRSTNGGRAWKEVPLPIGFDAILSLGLWPNFGQDGTLLAGTENNGLLISRDGGKSWHLMKKAMSAAPVNQILLSPASQQIFILHGGTLLASEDGGDTWRPWRWKQLANQNITAVLAMRNPAGSLLIGSEQGNIVLT
jgi:photosystem II stability/assembly factor-like uncharacterized protein